MINAESTGHADEVIRLFKEYVLTKPPNYGDGDSILTLLYEAYNEVNSMDNMEIKKAFHELYVQMNGILRDILITNLMAEIFAWNLTAV